MFEIIILLLVLLLPIYECFIDLWNKSIFKFIVVSKKDNTFKVHSEPLDYYDALEIKNKLKNQYSSMTLGRFPIYKEVLILKYKDY